MIKKKPLSATKKATTPVFKDLPAILSYKFKIQLDHWDIHCKTTTDSQFSPDPGDCDSTQLLCNIHNQARYPMGS